MEAESEWPLCRDQQHGFVLRHPPDWRPAGPPGRCAQFQRGEPVIPGGEPEVDVFIRVLPMQGSFPTDYLRPDVAPEDQRLDVGRAVSYSDRTELRVGGLPAVRARFRSAGPNPNWGVEYAIRKSDSVLDAYVSRPGPEVEADFDRMIRTIQW